MIEFRHLRYFVAVAEELNFRRAAERVHVDQTPLSRTVRDLEDQLGVLLIARTPRSLRLTPAGARLLAEARKILLRIERTKRVVRETDLRYRAPLRIGVADGIAQPKLAECFARWYELAPETPLDLSEMRAAELLAALQREEVDAGFSFGVKDDDSIEQEMAWSYPLKALVPATHELASLSAVSLVDVVAFSMIACQPDHGPGMRQQTDAIVRKYATAPVIVGEAISLGGLVTRVGTKMGIGLVDGGHLDALRRTDVVVVPLTEDVRITTYVLHKHQRFGSPDELQRFLAHVRTLS